MHRHNKNSKIESIWGCVVLGVMIILAAIVVTIFVAGVYITYKFKSWK
jgi:hypothetical protein